MSEEKTLSIVALAGEFKDKMSVQQELNRLFIANKIYVTEVEKLKAEIAHLQYLLSSAVPLVGDNTVEIISSNEKIICDMNINRIKDKTMNSEISFEDTKKLEILVKTKKIIEGVDPATFESKKKNKGNKETPEELLVSLAAQPIEEKK